MDLFACYCLLCSPAPAPESPHATEHTGWSHIISKFKFQFYYSTHNTQKLADHPYSQEIAGFWGYLFQIIYQTNAGTVMITDCVFWLIVFPFRAMKDYNLNLLLIGMHSVNVVFLMGDIILNNLRFLWFRIAYFLLFAGIYVALPLSGPIIISIPFVVFGSSSAASAMLCCVSLGYQIETFSLVKILFSFVPFSQANIYLDKMHQCLIIFPYKHLKDTDNIRRICSQDETCV